MAGKGGKKKDEKGPPKASTGKLPALLQTVFAVVAVLCATILALTALNVGPTGLLDAIHSLAIVPVALFAICALGAIFPAAAIRAAQMRAVDEKLEALEARLEGRVVEAITKVDTHVGDDYQAVREHNKQLQEKLEEFHAAEKDKMVEEMEKLRSLNGELEEQIKKWAIGSVDQIVSDTGTEGVTGNEGIKVA